MSESAHRNFFLTRKALTLLPLLLMGAGVFYYVRGRVPGYTGAGDSAPAPAAFGAAAAEGKKTAAAPLPDDIAALRTTAARIPKAYDPKAGLEIEESPEFKRHVTQALKLIWMADRETFLFIRRNLYVVRNDTQTGFYMENGRPVAALSNAHAFRSLTWCAGIIAHQAWHASYEFARRKRRIKTFTPPPPGEKKELRVEANPMRFDYKGMEAILYVEDRAASFQLEVLRKIGAPARETGPLFRRAPRDFHLSHDGNYSINP